MSDLTAKQKVLERANLILKIDEAKKIIEDNDTWGEIGLIIPDDSLTDEETRFAESTNIEQLAHHFKQVIFDIGFRNNCLNHEFAHQAVNRLKEAVYWAKEFIENRESEI